jgi:hypothetical protein
MEQFSKTLKLADGRNISIRPLSKEDGPALLDFFTALPAEDRLFLKEDKKGCHRNMDRGA